ncbi:MAG: CsgG/HfaB family protein [Candidatus Sericytochromatia bacterium]
MPLANAAENLPLLAVLELDARGEVTPAEAGTLTDRLRAHVIHAGRYQVLEREKMQAILKEQGFQQSAAACAGQDCSVRLGRLLGVRYLLSGSLSRVGGLYVLNARLLDVEEGLILREEYTDCECPLKELLTVSTLQLTERLLQLPPAAANPAGLSQAHSTAIETRTLAGSGWAGKGDGAALTASFDAPAALALLPDGSCLIADSSSQRLRRLEHDQVSTWAGADWNWLGGEILSAFADGPAAEARFHTPSALAADLQGIVYIADTDNHRIRKLLPDGRVISWVGTGEAGFSDGNAAVARFNRPQGLALDPQGNLYVADTDNHAIRKVSALGIVTTLAGGAGGSDDGAATQARFRYPSGLALAPDGSLYIADTGNHRIRRLSGGIVSTVAGGDEGFRDGTADEARFSQPRGLALAPEGSLYIADTGNHRIRQLAHGKVQTLAGTGSAGHADGNQAVGQFSQPRGLLLQRQELWVADTGNHRLRVIRLE